MNMNINNINRNVLNRSQYLFTEELQLSLDNEKLPNVTENKISTTKLGIYLVVIRVLNKNERKLVYNYIYYPPMFIHTLLSYFISKNDNSIRYNELGDLLLIINKDILLNNHNTKNEYLELDEYNRYNFNKVNYPDYILKNANSKFRASDTYEIMNLIHKMNYLTDNYEEQMKILQLALDVNYFDYIKLLLGDIYPNLEDKITEVPDYNLNIINTIMFAVQDINKFKDIISKADYNLNGGLQKYRDQINSMSYSLNLFDYDYRNSLYNHNAYHVKCGNIDKKFELGKSKFSFRNIHMNLGNVRYYSTKIDRSNMSKKLLDRVSNKNSFKPDSEIYLYLTRFLKEAPINSQTEKSIERFLLNFYNSSISSKENTSLIKYDLFNNKSIRKYIIDSQDVITEYLNNFKNKKITIDKKSNTNTLNKYRLSTILEKLSNKVILEICLGIIARIISNYNKPNDETITINILYDIGDIIVKSYFYNLYKEYYVENTHIFVLKCKEYLESNSCTIEDSELRNNILDKLSKLERNYTKLDVYELRILIKDILEIDTISKLDLSDINLLSNYTLSLWKLDNKELVSFYENQTDSTLKSGIGGIIVDWMIESDIIQTHVLTIGRTEKRNYLIPSNNIIDILKGSTSNSVKSLPMRIPMIVKPKPYYRELINDKMNDKLGGYLINDELVTDSMIIPNWELKESSIIDDPNVVYNLVNNVNSVAFKINKDLLQFIYDYTDKFELLLDYNINFDSSKPKITKSEYNELESIVSKLELQDNIMGLAEVYSHVSEFYLPVRIDSRGRMNCISQYLNYQSTELAKSLLLFSHGEKLYKNDDISIQYFKAYGANCYGNKLDKKSWDERSKWIDDNELDILNFTNSKLISKSDNKLLFAAFCLEYIKWKKSFDNIETSYFITHLPIQLDATCNGYQHLSLLIADYDMAKELNLTKSSKDESPKDYYSFMLIKLSEYFRSKIKDSLISNEDRQCYDRLSNLLLKRSSIKKAIMTIPYNVSLIQMIKYIKDNFIKIKDYDNNSWNIYSLEYQYKEDPNILLSYKDISLIASGLREVLETNFPRLKLLIIYLKNIAKICNKLNINISWGTSSGLLVNQSYTNSKEIKLRPFSYNKSSFTLNIPTDKINGNKQIRAFMPNLIHSLDAAALALLAEYHFNDSECKNFYAIHDCFAVTANNVEMLMKYLKLVYIKIYSEDDYLRQFDTKILQNIQYIYGKDCYDKTTRLITVELQDTEIKEKFPDINVVLGKELPTPELIKDSSYLIN